MIPQGWKETTLGECVSFLDGHRKPIKSEDRKSIHGMYPYYGATGIIDYINDYIFDDELLLLGEDGENILSRSLPHAFIINGKTWVNNHAHVMKPYKHVNIIFLRDILESFDYVPYNTGSAQPKLTKGVCERIKILLPPLAEQEKIAAILCAWDESISATDALLDNSRRQKKALMQQLLTGKKRLPGFSGKWEKIHLGDVISEEHTRNKNNSVTQVLSVTNHSGFVLPEEQFAKRVASENISNYKIIQKGQFGYNPSRLNVGSFDRLDKFEIGILSPLYVIFSIDEKKLNSDFFLHWMFSNEAKQRILGSTQGSVRDSVGFGALAAFPFSLPPLDEQHAIADVLTAADREIDLLQEKAARLRLEKKALMQQLLTGKIRVTV